MFHTVDCPEGYHTFRNYCYMIQPNAHNWYDAERFCSQHIPGGHLVWIIDSSENDFVISLLNG